MHVWFAGNVDNIVLPTIKELVMSRIIIRHVTT